MLLIDSDTCTDTPPRFHDTYEYLFARHTEGAWPVFTYAQIIAASCAAPKRYLFMTVALLCLSMDWTG